MKMKRSLESRIRGWIPKEPISYGINKAARQQKPSNTRALVFFSGILIVVIIAAGFFLVPLLLYDGESPDDGWVTKRVIERVGFPGGEIVVWKHSESSRDKGYITLDVEPKVNSEDELSAYINSRTTSLNQILENTNSLFEAIVTFKEPMSPEEFVGWCDASVEKAGDYAVVGKNFSNVYFLERGEEGYVMETSTGDGVIAVACYLQPLQARTLHSDPTVLLVEPIKDSQMSQILERYQAEGFNAQVQRSLSKEMWKQYAVLEGLL